MTGIYTGILAVTLWNIYEPGALHSDLQVEVNCAVINKLWPIRRALVLVIILLYILITTSFAVGWSSMHSAFIGNGKSFRTVYSKLNSMRAFYLEVGIAASASTSLTDLYMVSATLLRTLYIGSPMY